MQNKINNKFKDEITLSDSTKNQYKDRVLQIINRISKEKNKKINNKELVIWLIDNANNLSKNTFRLYKSAILYYLYEEINTFHSIEAANLLILYNSENSYKKSLKTSGKKSKNIKNDDLSKILEYLNKNNSKWDEYIKYWLLCGIWCGLRPIEWKDSEIITYKTGDLALKIKNAKNTNGRANGDYRILLLTNLTSEQIEIIRKHIYYVKSFSDIGEESYSRFYDDCSSRLNYINKKLFKNRKKNITLYSARHQFSANAKFSDKSKSEVAALMGHSIDETATIHYGKKRYGNNKIGVSPIKEQVNTVKSKNNHFNHQKNNNKIRNEKTIQYKLVPENTKK